MDQLVEELMNEEVSYEEALMYVLSLPSYEVVDDPDAHHVR